MNKPTISVIMPVYNGEKYLKEAIDSILNQTFSNFEFIILNDGSTDKTEEIILSYEDSRIVYVKNEKNIGITKTLNKGIALAKGEYIARMDADDISRKDRFEKQIASFQKNPKFKAVFSTVELIDENGNGLAPWELDRKCTEMEQILQTLPKLNCLAYPSVMFDATLFQKYRYLPFVRASQDYHFWLRLVSDGYLIRKIDEPLMRYRIHTGSVTQSSQTPWKRFLKLFRAKSAAIAGSLIHKKGLNRFDRKILLSIGNDLNVFLKSSGKFFVKTVLQSMGKLLYRLHPISIDADILFLFPSYHLGGAEKVHLDIVDAVSDRKIALIFTNPSHNTHFKEAFAKRAPIVDFSRFGKTLLGRYLLSGYLSRMVDASGAVTLFSSNCIPFYEMLPLLRREIRVIDLIHALGGGIESYTLPYLQYIDQRVIINDAVSDMLKTFYQKRHINQTLLERILVIENGVEVPSEYPLKRKKNMTVLYVGRGSPEKRVDLVMEVASECFAKQLDVSFALAGDISVSKKFVEEKRWQLLGPQKDLVPLYRKGDVILITSDREGFPMVLMEAMAYGVIPVSRDIGGISTHIKNGETGFLITENNEKEIVQQMVKIISRLEKEKELREQLSRNVYRYALTHFQKEKFKEAYRGLLDA